MKAKIAAFLCLLCISFSVKGQGTQPNVLFSDNFGRDSLAPWMQELGVWSLTNSTLVGTSDDGGYGNIYVSNNWTDYIVTGQIQFSTAAAWGAGLGGRLVDPVSGPHYAAWVYPEGSDALSDGTAVLELIKFHSWNEQTGFTILATAALPNGVGTNWHTVGLAFQGSNIFAYFDGQQVTNAVDDGSDGSAAYLTGGISADMYTYDVPYFLSVSNVTVTSLSGDDSFNVNQNATLSVPAPGVLGSDFDVFGSNLDATLVSGPSYGSLTLTNNGGFVYTPSNNFVGVDAFTYQPQDGTNTLDPATVTITVLPLTNVIVVAVNSTNQMYGATNPMFTVSYSGFVNGDTSNVLTGAPVITTGVTTNSPVGAYPITVSVGTLATTNGNYLFSFTNGTLTVNPAGLTVTASNLSKTYGQTTVFAGTEFSTSGLLNNDAVSSVSMSSPGAAAAATVSGSPYGIVPTNAVGTGLTNYLISYVNGALTVSKATLTVTANNTNRIYGAANPVFTASYRGFVNGETNTALSGAPNLTASAMTNSPVGGYAIIATNGTLSATNYSFSFTNGTLTIGKANLTVTANNTNRNYGATNPVFTASYSGFVNGDTNTVFSGSPSLTTSATTNSPVGGYAITATNGTLSATNYNFSFTNGTLTVGQAVLTVSANNTNRNYGATNPVFTASYSGFVNGETNTVLSGAPGLTTIATTNSPVGGYVITATNGTLSATNYSFIFTNGTLTIGKATLTVTANNTNRIYGATNPVFTASYSGFVNGDTNTVLSGAPSLTTIATTNSPVGGYVITATNGTLSATNYSFSFTNGTLIVGQAVLTVSANNTNRNYGATNPVFTASYSGFVNGDTNTVLSGAPNLTTSAATNSPVGGYVITATNGTLSATNYSFIFTNGTLTIGKAGLVVAANNFSRAYGATNPTFTVSYVGFVNADTSNVLSGSLGILSTVAKTNSPVGAYVITNTPGTLSAMNYAVTYTNGTLTVTQAVLTVTANNTNRSYGATNPVLTVSYSGFLNGDTNTVLSGSPVLTTTATTNTPAGGYAITTAIGTLSATNYSFAPVNGTLTINQVLLTVSANSTNRTYGATNPVFTATYYGFQNGETPSVLTGAPSLTTVAKTNSPVGTYAITNSIGTLSATNYFFNPANFTNGTLTVSPTRLLVAASNLTRVYGVTNPPLTFSFTGFVNGEGTNVLSGNFGTLNTSAARMTNVGVYVITNTPGSLSASNYTISYTNGTLTITQVVLTVTAGSTNRIYGATNPVFTVSYSGFVLNQTNTVLAGAPSVTTSATTNSPSGTYAIVVTNGTLSATNYSFSFVNGVLTITGGPPQLSNLTVKGNQLIFGWQSLTNTTYQVQYTTNLMTTNWTASGNSVNGTGGFMTATNSLNASPQRFFRLKIN